MHESTAANHPRRVLDVDDNDSVAAVVVAMLDEQRVRRPLDLVR